MSNFQNDILQLHILYLQKCESLRDDEREAFVKYLNHLGSPLTYVASELNFDITKQ